MKTHRSVLLAIGLGCWILFEPGLPAAQEAAPAAAAPSAPAPVAEPAAPAAPIAPAAPAAPEPVPVPEVAGRAEALRGSLRSVIERLTPDPKVAEIEQELPELRALVAARRAEADALVAESPTLDQLADLEREWASRTKDLSGRRAVLTKRAAAVEAEIAALDADASLWERTLEAATSTQAPEAVLDTIRSDLAEIAAVRTLASKRRGELLSLLNSVAQEELRASEMLSGASAARTELRSRLFEPDVEPLWVALSGRYAFAAMPGGVRETVNADATDVVRFVGERRGELLPVVLVFVAALFGSILVRNRIRRRGESHELSGSAQIFERPVSIALLLSFFAGMLLFPFAPSIARYVIGALLLIPVLRIVTPVVHRAFHPLLLAIAAFYLVDRARDIVDAVVLLERVLLFGEALAGSALIVWLLRPRRLTALSAEARPPAALGPVLRFSGLLLVGSALANALGFMVFARVLGEGTLSTAYLGVLFYAAYRVGLTLLLVLLSSGTVRRLGVVVGHGQALVRWSRRLLLLAATVLWAIYTLQAFGLREAAEALALTVLTTPLTLGTVSVSLGEVLGFGATIAAAFLASRAIRTIIEDDVLPRVTLRRGVGAAISATAHYVILLGGFLLALGAAGVDFSRFTLLAGAFGVGIGFGLQNVVNNFVSGLILLYERPVQVGDVVELGELLGTVTRIGIRSSTVRTFRGSEVIVPNGNLISEQLVNWTLSDPHRRIDVPVGVAYGSNHERVLEVLSEAVRASEHVLPEPEPMVLFRGFGDSSIDFEVRFWTTAEVFLQAASAVTGSIYAALDRAGIQIPFPQRDLHLRSVEGEAGRQLAPRDREATPPVPSHRRERL